MSERFPSIAPDALTHEQKSIHDLLTDQVARHYGDIFTTHDDTGALVGVFSQFLYLPASVATGFSGNVLGLATISNLSVKCREIAILAVGEHFGASYELYCHARVAKKAGIPDTQIQDILEGRPPSESNERELLSWKIARELVGAGGTFKKGRLSENLWRSGEEAFGKECLGGLIHFIGFYAYVCITLNAGGILVPHGENIWPITA
ncbi:hypothetical protein TWF718_007619 [Orbilia javanica]|uniref:Carboxymuconolactone decarboxylase-like domain-containing protein n=1 Tax=Orbilia javanica TaxID=47235 RepID=A0AAN8MRN9_9PEZI